MNNEQDDGAELILRLVAADGVVGGHRIGAAASNEPQARPVDPAEIAWVTQEAPVPNEAQERARMRRRNAKTIGL